MTRQLMSDRPVLSSEMVPHLNTTIVVRHYRFRIWSWVP